MGKYFNDKKVLRCVTDAGANMIKIFKPAAVSDEPSDDEEAEEELDLSESEDSDEVSHNESDEQIIPEVIEVETVTEPENEYNSQNIKRFNCFTHVFSTVCSNSFDSSGAKVHAVKQKVMKFVNQFSHSGKKTEHLLQKTEKHLIRFAKTRWNYFYFVYKYYRQIYKYYY